MKIIILLISFMVLGACSVNSEKVALLLKAEGWEDISVGGYIPFASFACS